MTIWFILLIIGAYLLGSVPAAYLVARWSRGIDIRKYGSGNVGASNILTVASKRWAVPVIIFDVGKGMLAVYVAQLIGLEVYQQAMIGVAAIIGHNWSIFLGFNGGRGGLTLLGVAFILVPKLTLVLAVIPFTCLLFKQMPVGVLCAVTLLPIFSWFLRQPFNIEEPLSITIGSLAILLIVLIKRLTAPRTLVTASVSRGELFVNRLLFDRDIRDREAWIHRAPPEQREK